MQWQELKLTLVFRIGVVTGQAGTEGIFPILAQISTPVVTSLFVAGKKFSLIHIPSGIGSLVGTQRRFLPVMFSSIICTSCIKN